MVCDAGGHHPILSISTKNLKHPAPAAALAETGSCGQQQQTDYYVDVRRHKH